MQDVRQHSPSFERNKDAILSVLREILPPMGLVLEIGSGSGQHAAYIAPHLPCIDWQPTDLPENLPSIAAWREASGTANLRAPLVLDVLSPKWPIGRCDAVVCINTVHIVAWAGVQNLFAGAGRVLRPGGVMYVYGAYRYPDRPLEPSNEQFDQWLKRRDPSSGVRDFAAVDALAQAAGLTLAGDRAMPANNRSIWWRKS